MAKTRDHAALPVEKKQVQPLGVRPGVSVLAPSIQERLQGAFETLAHVVAEALEERDTPAAKGKGKEKARR